METKRYFSRVPGSAFVFSDGTRAVFAHGFLDVNVKNFPGEYRVSNPNPNAENMKNNGRSACVVYREELDELCAKGNPLIFTQDNVKQLEPLPSYAKEATQAARSEAEIAGADAALRNAGIQGRVSGDVNDGKAVIDGGDPNKSTVDPMIQTAMLAARNTATERPVVGPGSNDAASVARAAANARLQAAAAAKNGGAS